MLGWGICACTQASHSDASSVRVRISMYMNLGVLDQRRKAGSTAQQNHLRQLNHTTYMPTVVPHKSACHCCGNIHTGWHKVQQAVRKLEGLHVQQYEATGNLGPTGQTTTSNIKFLILSALVCCCCTP